MTERDIPDASETDELASALVDGEASDAEVARAGEPEVASRVTSFRAVARLVATPVEPVDELSRTRAIRAALAVAGGAAPAAGSRRAPAWLAPVAAAVVVLAGVGLFVAALAGGGSDDQTASGDAATEATALADAFEDAAGGEGTGGSSAGAPAPAADGAESSAMPGDLGAFADAGELEAALRAHLAPTSDDDSAGGGAQRSALLESAGCDDTTGDGGSQVVDALRATLGSEPVVVVVRRAGDGTRSYAAIAERTCEVLASGEL